MQQSKSENYNRPTVNRGLRPSNAQFTKRNRKQRSTLNRLDDIGSGDVRLVVRNQANQIHARNMPIIAQGINSDQQIDLVRRFVNSKGL